MAVEDVGTRVIVSDARLLDQVADRPPSLLRVRLDLSALDTGALDRLQELILQPPRPLPRRFRAGEGRWHGSHARSLERRAGR